MSDLRDSLAEAKRRLPLPSLMAQIGFADRAKKSARCPFHEDSSASFSVFRGSDGQVRWKCHAGCGQGDAIDFLARVRNLSQADAIREFKRLAGVLEPVPAPARQAPSTPPATPPPFDWASCVSAFTPEQQEKLATWRGYSTRFVAWLHAQGLVGLFAGERVAFPVHDSGGQVVGCHYRLKEDGSWRYHPAGTRTSPLVIGNAAAASTVFAFESQWDALAVLDTLHHHIEPLPGTVCVATRGAKNCRLLAGMFPKTATAFAFAQNDPAGMAWLSDTASHCGCECRHAITPPPHKDANDWIRAGASAADIRAAIDSAEDVVFQPASDLHASPRKVSTSIITLPPEDEDDESKPDSFPLDALPASLAGIVAAVSRSERVPVALPALCALGVMSASIGAGLEVVSGPNRTTRGNLFLLGSAESGSGKSETFRLIAAPLIDHQARLLEVWRENTSPKLQSEIRVLEKEAASLERKAAKTPDPNERERLRGELEYRLARKDTLLRQAAMPCVIAQDVTTERLAVLLRDNREVIFSASADARKVIDNIMGRYSATKTTDESLYLSAFSGDFVRVDRQGRDAVVLHKPCLSLCWLVQPDMLSTMLDEASLSSSGFLPRLLTAHTNATPRRIDGDGAGIFDAVRSQWTGLITDLLGRYHAAERPFRIEPSPEAKAGLDGYHNRIVDRRAGDLADVGAFAARYAEQAWRVAVVLHAALHGTAAAETQLDAETASNAVRVVEWFSGRQLDALAKGRRAAAQKVEAEVLELLDTLRQRKGQDFLSARDVYRSRIVANAEAAAALLARMEGEGTLKGEDVRRAEGGRPTRIFRGVINKNPVPE